MRVTSTVLAIANANSPKTLGATQFFAARRPRTRRRQSEHEQHGLVSRSAKLTANWSLYAQGATEPSNGIRRDIVMGDVGMRCNW
jgi:hypothetical protein